MELSNQFLLRVLFLALPGIVGCKLLRALSGRPYERAWDAWIDALLLSTSSYLIAALVRDRSVAETLEAFTTSTGQIPWSTIASATILVLPLSIAMAWFGSKRWVFRVGRRFGITRFAGSDDVWSYFLDHSTDEWHLVRDYSRGITYLAHIEAYSDSEKKRELWLSDVTAYDGATEDVLFKSDELYWAGDSAELTLQSAESHAHTEHERD